MINNIIQLRPYQEKLVSQTRLAYGRGAKAPIIVLPTGGGKTVVISYIAAHGAKKGSVIYILAHRKELIEQISNSLINIKTDHEIIDAQNKRIATHKKVFVASVQTLVRRLHLDLPKPDLIIIDEAHHLIQSSTWGTVINHFKSPKLLLVTATPCRLSGEGLGQKSQGYSDFLIQGPTTKELIKDGFLVQYKYYAPSKPDLKKVKTVAGDYDQVEAAFIMSKAEIVGDVVENYLKYAKNKRAIIFCVNVEHAKIVNEAFKQAGVQSSHLDAKSKAYDREDTLKRFANGTIKVLTNVNLFTEGFDLPSIDAVIMCRPTQSLSLYLQMVGRALRPSPGTKKTHAILIDHASNYERHGFPDDSRTWSLDAKKKRKKDRETVTPLKTCQVCFAVCPSAATKCPECDEPFETKENETLHADGELVEINPYAAEFEMYRNMRYKDVLERAKTFDQLLIAAKARGYKPGWAKKIYDLFQNRHDR